MLQPFERLKPAHIYQLISLKKRFLVSQDYPRGQQQLSHQQKTPILVTAYEDLAMAHTHRHAVKTDQYSAIIDLENEKHLQKLQDMVSPSNAQYDVYWAVLKDAHAFEKQVNNLYKEHLRRYINAHTDWKTDAGQLVRPAVQLVFGELFVILRSGNQTLKIKFDELEKA